jgi:hypothetical protein
VAISVQTIANAIDYLLALAADAAAASGAGAEALAGVAGTSTAADAAGFAGDAAGASVWLAVSCFSPLISTLSPPLKIINRPKPANTIKPNKIFHIANSFTHKKRLPQIVQEPWLSQRD